MAIKTDTIIHPGLNLAVSGAKWVVPVEGWQTATFQAKKSTGAWGGAVITIYRSNDGVNGYAVDEDVTATGDGHSDEIDVNGFAFLIAQVTTTGGPGKVALHCCRKKDV